MTDLTSQIKDQRGGFAKILSKIPGFKGYMEKETRRDADKIVRDAVAAKFTDQLDRLTELQNDMLSNGGFEYRRRCRAERGETAHLHRSGEDRAARLCRLVRRRAGEGRSTRSTVQLRLSIARAKRIIWRRRSISAASRWA